MKRWFGIILVFALLLSVVACDTQLTTKPTSTKPRQADETVSAGGDAQIDTIFSLVKNGQWSVLQSWLTFDTQDKIDPTHIRERQERIYERLGVDGVDLIDVQKIERASDERIAIYDVTMVFVTKYGRIERPFTVTFLKNSSLDRWELDWTPSLIFPGLTDDNDLIVERSSGERGQIYDRNGKPLAQLGERYTVGAVAGSYDTNSNAAVADLLGIEVDQIERIMSQSWIGTGMFVPLMSTLSLSPSQLERLPNYGLTARRSTSRIYPEGEILAHYIGYIGEVTSEEIADGDGYYEAGDLIGKRGLELLYEKRLRPKHGVTVYLSGTEREVLYHEDGGNGEDIYLTIDASLQRTLYELLAEDEGQATVIAPETGDLLALVSVPSFDPNLFVQGIPQATYQALLDDPLTPMLNRFQLRYAPGSTAKILTFLAGYNLGVISDDTIKTITEKTWQPGPSWGGYEVTRLIDYLEPQDPKHAIQISDNIFFAQVAVEAGKEAFMEQWASFGVGENMPCDYPFYRSQVSNDDTFDNEVLLADAAYGQGQFQITVTQLAEIYGGVINGNIYAPRMETTVAPTIWKADIASEATRESLIEAMRLSIETTHVNTVEREYAMLTGKSGTVEMAFDSLSGKAGIDSWFLGYDQNNPAFVLGIQLQNIQRRDDGVTAAIRFGEAFDLLYAEGETVYQPKAILPD